VLFITLPVAVTAQRTAVYFGKWHCTMGRDRATRYGLDGPGIESRWGANFSAPVHTGPGAHPAGTGSFPGVMRREHGVDHPPHLMSRLKKEQSYTSTPPLDLRACSEVNFTFYLSQAAFYNTDG